MRVLIVDDDVEVLDVLSEVLSAQGCAVCLARTGGEAMAMATTFLPDVALVDVGLPDIDGATLPALLRAAVPDHPLRVIGHTGVAPARLREAARRAMFDALVLKPATLEQLRWALGIDGST